MCDASYFMFSFTRDPKNPASQAKSGSTENEIKSLHMRRFPLPPQPARQAAGTDKASSLGYLVFSGSPFCFVINTLLTVATELAGRRLRNHKRKLGVVVMFPRAKHCPYAFP